MRPQHLDTGKVLTGLTAERRNISTRAAAEPDERHYPRDDTGNDSSDDPYPDARTRQDHPEKQRHRQNRHLRPEPDRQPREKRSDHQPPWGQISIFHTGEKIEI